MSLNTIITKGHHTCIKGVDAYILNNAPFLSNTTKRNGKTTQPYLGSGYYLWDDNIKAAQWWGKEHYNDKHTIVEYDLNLTGDTFLDLVGDRGDIIEFCELYNALCKKENKKLSVAEAIEILIKLNKNIPGIFEYNIIRAHDCKDKYKTALFDYSKKGYINLDPKFIICYKSKGNIPQGRII